MHSKMCVMNFRNAPSRHLLFALIGLAIFTSPDAFALEKAAKPIAAKVASPILNWQKTELFFGLSRPNGLRITTKEWVKFSSKEITPRFPQGFTTMNGVGQWRMENGKIAHENTKILLVLHENTEYSERAFTKIIAAYKKQFNQESVLRITSAADVQF